MSPKRRIYKLYKDNKKWFIIGFILIVAIITIAVTVPVVISLKNRRRRPIPPIIKPDEPIPETSITAKFNTKNGRLVVNPEYKNSFSRFEILYSSDNNKGINLNSERRNLNEGNNTIIENIEIPSNIAGEVTVLLIFNEKLNSTENLFKDITGLISIDLKNVTLYEDSRIQNTFDGCTNLENVDNFNTSLIDNFTNLFKNCESLQNPPDLDYTNAKVLENLFAGCKNIFYINMTTIRNEILNEISKITDQKNVTIDIDADIRDPQSIEQIDFNVPVNIVIKKTRDNYISNNANINFINNLTCSYTNGCVSCGTVKQYLCNACEEGYYLEYGNESKECKVCQSHCTRCHYDYTEMRELCDTAENGYILINYKPYLKCQNGYNNCLQCNADERYMIDCSICENGYYLASDTKQCKKCDIEKCSQCEGTNDIYRCINCNDDTELSGGKCYNKCLVGSDGNCKECDDNVERISYCKNCNQGYYIPIDDPNPTYCHKCTDNCQECSGTKRKSTCDKCMDGYTNKGESCVPICKEISEVGTDNSKCVKCSDESKFMCNECIDNYIVNQDGQCVKKILDNCENEEIDGQGEHICLGCSDGYKLLENSCFKECDIGDFDKCMTCDYTKRENEGKCLTCNEGYYLKDGKCNKIPEEGCLSAILQDDKIICLTCDQMHFLDGENCIERCKVDDNDESTCSTCDSNHPNLCGSCHDGYLYDNGECIYIDIHGCRKAEGTKVDYKCIECISGYGVNKEENICQKNCVIGIKNSMELCKTCDECYPSKCGSCYEGYYIDSSDPTKCEKCTLDHCLKCMDNVIKPECEICEDGYRIEDGVCVPTCDIGKDNKCNSCSNELGYTDYCGSCNSGYYLPEGEEHWKVCKKCDTDNCNICCGDKYTNTCKECIIPYELVEIEGVNKCIASCTIGSENKCNTCSQTFVGDVSNCETCNEKYFIPDDVTDKTHCYLCNENCKVCSGTKDSPYCTICEDGYTACNGECIQNCIKGSNELCKECNKEPCKANQCESCNRGYYLPTDKDKQTCTKISDDNCISAEGDSDKYYCIDCIIPYTPGTNGFCEYPCNKGPGSLCSECDGSNCSECNEGYYLPSDKDQDKTKCESCESHIGYCKKCIGKNRGGKNGACLLCENLCPVCPDITCLECKPGYEIYENKCIPDHCDISDEKSDLCKTCCVGIGNRHKCCSCHEGYYTPTDATDDELTKCTKCQNNCLECYGTKSNPICTKCESGYVLIGGNCTPDCKLYDGTDLSMCKKCSREIGNFECCEECNDGYMPIKHEDTCRKCQKCSIEGCKNCYLYNANDICGEKCKYLEGYDQKEICKECTDMSHALYLNGTIIACNNTCDIGNLYHCKSCSTQPGKETWCTDCNSGYKLDKNSGKCVSDWDVYIVLNNTSGEKYIRIIGDNYDILNLNLDGANKGNNENKKYLMITDTGIHRLYINFRPKNTNSLNSLFIGCSQFTSVVFTNKLGTSKFTDLSLMFGACINIVSVDMSALSLTMIKNMNEMFLSCTKLKYIEFGNIETKNVENMNGLFKECESLESIDLSSWKSDSLKDISGFLSKCRSLKFINLEFLPTSKTSLRDENYVKDMFKDTPTSGVRIIYKKNLINMIKSQIPNQWEKIER